MLLTTAMWHRPPLAGAVVVALCPVLSGLGRGLVAPGLKISELLLVLAAVVVFLRAPQARRPLSSAEQWLLVFAVVSAGLAVLHLQVGQVGLGSTIRIGLQPVILYLTWWTASRAVTSVEEIRFVLRWVVLATAVMATVAILQYFDIAGVREGIIAVVGPNVAPEPGVHPARVTGLFPIAHSMGGQMLVPLVLMVALLLRRDRSVLPLFVVGMALATCVSAVMLSVTVTIISWVFFAIIIVALRVGRIGGALTYVGAAVLGGALLFREAFATRLAQQSVENVKVPGTSVLPETVAYRIFIWQRDYIPLLRQSPVVGFGTDAPPSVMFTSTENQFVTYMLRGGLFLTVFAIICFATIVAGAISTAETG
ncbi:hypothetical protein BJF86_02485 [Serinicoccus sp. CNJ-927]|uniref:hypothetical protein n=1 Tax=Serinicoccus sp. CNJ-927 TaxID=1904970 RepID=UPI00095CC294|nr:hypothetical protein [Serinicoccus sp. CNJ-927]OLT41893.1 hypothetical protein BJF86_02485 [Serinicoccus sp. CNJ-927]